MKEAVDFLIGHNLFGLTAGIFTFLIIGLFHPLVIKAEYHIGTRSWILFLALGLISVILSLAIGNLLWSVLLGVTAFSSFWSILEVFQQAERVRKGWFPANPRRETDKVRASRNRTRTV